jgi:hypothetical protein
MPETLWTNCGNCGKRLHDGQQGYCDDVCEKEAALVAEKGLKGTPCGRRIVDDDEIWNGTWEHIAWDPIKITGGRKELIEVCKKHGKAPRALLKHKSQGSGLEMSSRAY